MREVSNADDVYMHLKSTYWDCPGESAGGLDSWLRKITHAEEQLSLSTTTTEPVP